MLMGRLAGRNLLFTALSLSLSILIALALGEGIIRLFFPPPQMVFVEQRTAPTPAPVSPAADGLYFETGTGRRIKPNVEAKIRNHSLSKLDLMIRTNSLGFRNPELSAKTHRRVLFLGDSITLADYLPEEDTFVRLVETYSKQEGRPIETVNAGVGAISLQNELAILLEAGVKTEPDGVVLGFYLNDFAPSPYVKILNPPPALQASWLAHYIFKAINAAALDSDKAAEIYDLEMIDWFQEVKTRFPAGPGDPLKSEAGFNAQMHRHFRDWGSAYSDTAWDRTAPLFNELVRLSKVHSFKLYVIMHPVDLQVYAEHPNTFPQERMRAMLAESKIPFLDLLPVLRGHRKDTEKLFFDQCHHTPYASRIVARAIFEFLRVD